MRLCFDPQDAIRAHTPTTSQQPSIPMADQSSSISTTSAGRGTEPPVSLYNHTCFDSPLTIHLKSEVWRVPLPRDIDYNLEFVVSVGDTRGVSLSCCIENNFGRLRMQKNDMISLVDQAQSSVGHIPGIITPRRTVAVRRVLVSPESRPDTRDACINDPPGGCFSFPSRTLKL